VVVESREKMNVFQALFQASEVPQRWHRLRKKKEFVLRPIVFADVTLVLEYLI